MKIAMTPKINCRMLGPINGICTSSYNANVALPNSTAIGPYEKRRHAIHAAAADGSAVVVKSHTPGRIQVDSPTGRAPNQVGCQCQCR